MHKSWSKRAIYIALPLLVLLFLSFWPLIDSPSNTLYLRASRLCNALIAGACLSFAGLSLQHITKNPIVDPYITGIAPASILGMVIGSLTESVINLPLELVFSICAAILASMFTFVSRRGSKNIFILAGIMIGGLCLTVTNLLVYLNPSNTRILSIYSSLYSNLDTITPLWGYIALFFSLLFSFIFDFYIREKIQGLQISRERSQSLGINLSGLSFFMAISTSIITCLITTTFGLIGFIGFIVPNIFRYLIIFQSRYVFLSSLFLGSLLLATVDSCGRMLSPPYGIPAGLITPILGIPLLFFLMRTNIIKPNA